MSIRNPAEWGAEQIAGTGSALRAIGHALFFADVDRTLAPPQVRRISLTDLRDVLRDGFADFAAFRDDVIFLCIVYPLGGFILAAAASDAGLLPLVFPLFASFTLIGPFAALGLYELSRRRERGETSSWADAVRVFASPSAAAIFKLGLLFVAILALWLAVAMSIYTNTIGPEMPASARDFAHDVFTTPAGWMLIVAGVGAGFLFALFVLAIGAVSFPLLLDRQVSISTAMATSFRALKTNPGPMLAWGFIVAAGLVLGMIPLMMGLVIVLPVLGHATRHLYRKLVV